MRTIKFRGKRPDTMEWAVGSLVECYNGKTGIVSMTKYSEENGIKAIIDEVSPDTIGQYTGLKDKNGKEIYEGDIIAHNDRVIGHIIGGVRGYCYDVIYKQPAPEKDWSLYGVVIQDYDGEVEIIGNRFDNPELLK